MSVIAASHTTGRALVASLKERAKTQDSRRSKVTNASIANCAAWLKRHGYDDRLPETHRLFAQFVAVSVHGTPKTGILLTGCTGSGKTLPMQLLRDLLQCCWWDAPEVALSWHEGQKHVGVHLEVPLHHAFERPQDAIVDDLGSERTIHSYGEKYEALTEYIAKRHEVFMTTGALTHFTTNLNEADMIERYGDRAVSRLHQMCVWASTGNTDWRREDATKLNGKGPNQ